MTVEAATTIADLDVTLPLNANSLTECDDHIRLIKAVLKAQFPGITTNGFNAAVLVSELELNYLSGISSAFQAQIDLVISNVVPVGGISMYSGLLSAIPSNWQLADGTNGSANLIDLIPMGTNTENELLTAGGSATKTVTAHTHDMTHNHADATTTSDGDHTHGMDTNFNSASGANFRAGYLDPLKGGSKAYPTQLPFTSTADGAHSHTLSVASTAVTTDTVGVTGDNTPQYVKLVYIQRMT